MAVTVTALSDTAVLLPVGGLWVLTVETRDLDGALSDDPPTVTVTLPDGTTAAPTVETVITGWYRCAYQTGVAGRFTAAAATADDLVEFAAYAADPTDGTGMPDTSAVATYMGASAASWTTAELQDALDTEAAAQRSVCRVGAVYPPDLREALYRRVQRNLAMRSLPLAITQPDTEGGVSVLPGSDPEIRRLERPHRKLPVG